MRGAIVVETLLLLLPLIMLFAFASEFLRFSLIRQTLASATHQSAQAVAALPNATGCEAAVRTAFRSNSFTAWLLDQNDDGTLDVQVVTADGWPAAAGDVAVAISWDEPLDDAVDFGDATPGGCGGAGSWARIRARIAPQLWYGAFRPMAPNGLVMTYESWARNTRS